MDEHRLSTPLPRETALSAGRTSRAMSAEDTSLEPLLRSGIRTLRRRFKLAVLVFLLFTVPTTVLVLRKPPRYEATARILVERSDEVDSVFPKPRDSNPAADDFRTQSELLRSRPIVAKAIKQIKLWEAPEFALPISDVTEAHIAASGLVDAFLARLRIAPAPGTHVLNVTFEAADAPLAMKAVNALVQRYIDEQTKAQFAASAEVVRWLNDRLVEQRTRLEASEAALQTYMESQDAVSVQDRQNIVVQKLADLNAAVTRAKTDRMAKQTLYTQLRSMQESRTVVDGLPVVLSNPVLQQLRAQLGGLKQKELILAQDLGDRHPDLINLRSEIDLTEARLRAELAKVVESVQNDFAAAEALERSLVGALEAQKREVVDLNRKSLEYGGLHRQAVSDRQIYERLLTEVQARGIAGKSPETKIRIVEAAELPRFPVGPRRARELLLVLCGGLLLAISAPIVRESLDHHVKTPAEIEQRLGLRCLAMVPAVDSASVANPPSFTDEATPFNEAFRRVRTAISLALPAKTPRRVLVTSALPREGKTVVAVNLAMALAQTSQRVLLIDSDLRKPKVHEMLGVSPFPGFADLLNGGAAAGDVVRQTRTRRLFVLPCGLKQLSASELLSSPGLEPLLDQFQATFDWIVFDSPPTGPVADACVIAQWVHHAIIVIGADSTPFAVARAAVDQLEAAGAKVAGAVLNRVDLKHSAYYYAPYYSGEYEEYYSPSARQGARQEARVSDESAEAVAAGPSRL
jgi:capsular exopolysaccharide synthesis family protein